MTLSKAWQLVFYAWSASEVLLLLATRTRRQAGSLQDRGSLLILWPVIFGSIWFAFEFGARHGRTIFPARGYTVLSVSFALLLVGIAVRLIAIFSLGRSFSVNVAIRPTQTVYKSGLYRFMRHPSYTGLLLIFVAIGLGTRNWVSLAVMMVFPLAALLYRIHVEEQALIGAFGDEYVSYSRHTARLIPGVY